MDPISSDAEQEELSRLTKGDERAFTEIYNRYWERLFFMAYKRISSTEDAKEIIQNVFLTLWQKRGSLQIQNLSLYLAAMTRYAVYRHLSNEKRREDQLKNIRHSEVHKVADSFDLDNKQLLDILSSLSNELPEKYRLVFIHHKLLDRPLEEVAEQLGVSPRTAEGYVAKVMEIMRQHRRKLSFSIFML